jgi:hypothetical protein
MLAPRSAPAWKRGRILGPRRKKSQPDFAALYNGTAGNFRFDMVTFSGKDVPEPSTAILAACGFAAALTADHRRRETRS